MTAEVDIGHEVKAEVDPTLMRTVFDNLLSNAIKYGREGGKIRISCESEDTLLRFHVWNEGRGIEREDVGNLFEKFSRLEDIERQRRPGTGLGLFITKRVVEEHQGRIWVESEPGQWADFVFELPRKEGGGNRNEAENTSGG